MKADETRKATTDTDWRDLASCKGSDTEIFFPTLPHSPEAAQGKAICARCPVKPDCATWAAEHPDLAPFGIWGGLTEWERFPRRRRPDAKSEAKRRRRKVADMRSRGVTISVIARELDVSVAIVQKDISRLAMATQQKKDVPAAEVARLLELGWSHREVARKFGVRPKTIYRIAQRSMQEAS